MLKLYLRLALRNILRNKRRSALTFGSIVFGMTSLICFGGFVAYTYWGLREVTIHSELGHIQIFRAGHADHAAAAPNRYLLQDYEKIEKEVAATPGVRTVTARFGFAGLISKGERTLNCLATGIVPERETELSDEEKMIRGEKLSADNKSGIVLGESLSRSLGADVGDAVTLLTTTTTGMINAQDLVVVGIVRIGAKEYDSVFVKTSLSVAQKLLNTTEVEKVVVLLNNTDDAPKVAESLRRQFAENKEPLEVKSWYELADFYRAVVRLYNGTFRVVGTIIAALFLFGIANTMTMSVFERVREIGTLRALGTRKKGIVLLFLSEGLMLGVIGGLLGVISGVLCSALINALGGVPMPAPPGRTEGYHALIAIHADVLLMSFVGTVLVAVASSIFPACRAAGLSIVKAIGHS